MAEHSFALGWGEAGVLCVGNDLLSWLSSDVTAVLKPCLCKVKGALQLKTTGYQLLLVDTNL